MIPPPLTVTAAGPGPPDASPLERLLHPLTPETFRRDYWMRYPLHLTGWSERCAGVFGRDRLVAALERQDEAAVLVRVSTDHEGDDGGAGAHQRIAASDVDARLASGASVCIDPIDQADPALAAFALDLKAELGHAGPVNVKCYLSPERYGFNTHLDAHVVTTLQIEGSKRWRVSTEPGVPYPLDNAFLDDQGAVRSIGRPPSALRDWERPAVDTTAFAEVLLQPGDVLCLPAGTWHEAKASGGQSLALNVAFPPADPLTLILDEALAGLRELPGWRAGLPAAEMQAAGQQLPEVVRAYLAKRTDELLLALRDALAGPRVAARWRAAVADADGTAGRTRSSDLDAATRPTNPLASPGASAPPAPSGNGLAGSESPGQGDRQLQCVLGVADATAAAAWYRDVLGCAIVSTIPEFGWVELSTPVPGVTLGLTELPTTRPGAGAVLDFGVDDVEVMRGVLADHGVLVTEPVREIAGVARFLVAHDPDGNPLMFFEGVATP